MTRCPWCGDDPLYVRYHDTEWGVPIHDDRRLFAFIVLEGAQAGLSWITILRRREGYRAAFDDFDPTVIARYDDAKIQALLQDARIIRNRRKVESVVRNARAFLAIQEEYGSFDAWIWDFMDGRPVQNAFASIADLPPATPLSEKMSKALQKRGFSFVGPTIWYAHMQATGMVNDHLVSCFRHPEVAGMASPP